MNGAKRTGYTACFDHLRHDLPASIVVFLVALPLCMGIAIASGVPVGSGLVTGIVGGILVGALGGAPLQVSGPAAGLVVIVYELVERHGLPMLGLVVFAAGALQMAAGALRLGQWFRAVSPAVIHGMLAGIGVLIVAGQFHVMVDDEPQGSGLQNILILPRAVKNGLPWPALGSSSDRERKLFLLQQAGGLHEHQSELQEAVAEHVSREPSPEDEAHYDPQVIAAWVERQSDITSQLGELLAMAERDREADPRRKNELPAAASRAYRAAQMALDHLEERRLTELNASQTQAVAALSALLAELKNHDWAAKVGLLTIAVILLWQAAFPKGSKIIPSPLAAISIATLAAVIFKLPVLYVELPDRLIDTLRFPTLTVLSEAPLTALLPYVLIVAVVASAETLLCATAVDRLHHGASTRYDRELAAQGLGNMLCGLLGGLPMTGVIVRSAANVEAGAKTRLSAVLHGFWLLLFVSALGFLLRNIPTSALAAILVYTGYKLININAIRELWAYGKGEVLIYAATVFTVVVEDLLTGVCVGVVLSAGKLLYTFSRLNVRVERSRHGKRWIVRLEGAATFLQLPKLAKTLDSIPADVEAHIVCDRLRFIDHACIELLNNWTDRHSANGGSAFIDWEALHDRSEGRMRRKEVEQPV